MRWSYVSLGFAVVLFLIAIFFFGASWLANLFYYDNGQSAPTEADLNKLMLIDVLLIGLPLFLSGFFFGKCRLPKLPNNNEKFS